MTKSISSLVVVFVVICCSASCVTAWGQEGHSIVADIASTFLTSRAQDAVAKYLGSQTMQNVSSVPDTYDHLPEGKWSEPLHFCDMLRNQTGYDAKINCNPLCVVGGIQNYTKRLIANYTQYLLLMQEPSALTFLIHFVGDVHQPLHVGWADDVGGNTIKVQWYGKNTELHAVWDDSIIEKYNPKWKSFSDDLQDIIKKNSTVVKLYTEDMDPATWANESFGYVRSQVYIGVTGVNPNLTDDYYNRNIPLVKARLMAAGIRLGTLLNTIFSV